MATVSLSRGESVWYRKLGSGAPLLHIHGSAFGHRNFEKLTPLVAEHFQVIDFDLPGFGESRGEPRPGGMEGLAEQVFELVGALGYDRLHVHGTSFGGMVALVLAARFPQIIDRLIMSCFLARYDQAARMMRATWKRAARDSGMQAVADLTAVAGFARAFYERADAEAQLASMREAFSQTAPDAFIAGTETVERSDLSRFAPEVAAPTLLIAGDEDNMTPFDPAPSGIGFSRIQEMLPSCETAMLPNCGHYLVLEQPARVAALIHDFLNR